MIGLAVLLAHQGGWDEMLLVAAPIAIFVGLLRIANARAAAAEAEAGSGADPSETGGPTPPSAEG